MSARRIDPSVLRRGVLMFAVTACATAGAQSGTVRGVVTDTSGAPLANADVGIATAHQLTRTDSVGRFELSNVPRGEYDLLVRHLGYRPQATRVSSTDALNLAYAVALTPQALVMPGMSVSATEMRLRLGIEDFYRRRIRRNGGVFFTQDDVKVRQAQRTSDLLRTTPGVRLVRTRSGMGVRFTGSSSARRECSPDVWLDGQLVGDMELDDVPVTDLEGLELYAGPSTTPMQFSHSRSKDACGTIVVWTRLPGGY